MTADLFGTPEPPSYEPRVWSVSELTRAVRATLEEQIGAVWVEGEISNYRRQPSGHQYFTLKDATSQVACVWFARGGFRIKQLALADGMQVQVRGGLTVYEARGQYQLNVQLVQAGGAGLLQAKFEALKRKLEAEGLFDAERKRPLPKFPAVLGIVTSPTGAALRDILNILSRRAPWVRVVIAPVRVQGEGAAGEIAAAVAELNAWHASGRCRIDVVLVTRGGGSTEDLWQFNEENLARAIAASEIPVVSAVGHEIDFTIADFVADLRAPTPSAAAELLVPDGASLSVALGRLRNQLQRLVISVVVQDRRRLELMGRSAALQRPIQRLREVAQKLDLTAEDLERRMAEQVQNRVRVLVDLAGRLRHRRPDQLLALRAQELAALKARIERCFEYGLQRRKGAMAQMLRLLNAVSPQVTLGRGYSITSDGEGRIIRTAAEVAPGATLVTRFRDGKVRSKADSE